MDLEPYLELLGLDKKPKKKARGPQAIRRGIPYTPQVFPPEDRP